VGWRFCSNHAPCRAERRLTVHPGWGIANPGRRDAPAAGSAEDLRDGEQD
jgi:hypothetical protein